MPHMHSRVHKVLVVSSYKKDVRARISRRWCGTNMVFVHGVRRRPAEIRETYIHTQYSSCPWSVLLTSITFLTEIRGQGESKKQKSFRQWSTEETPLCLGPVKMMDWPSVWIGWLKQVEIAGLVGSHLSPSEPCRSLAGSGR
jgi:hypothetical protein